MAEFQAPSAEAQDWLRQNPDRAADFNKKFGEGAAEGILGESQEEAEEAPAEETEEGPSTLGDMARGVVSGVENAITETSRVMDSISPTGAIESGIEAVTGVDPVPDTPEDARVDFGGKKPVTTAGKVTEGVVQFAAGLVGFKGLGGALTAGTKGTIAAGAASDAFAFDPDEGNLSTFLEQHDWAIPVVTEALATDPEDPEWVNRVRNAAEGLALGGATDLFVKSLKATAKGFKGKKIGGAAGKALQDEAGHLAREASDEADRMLEEGVTVGAEETAQAAGRGAAGTTKEAVEETAEGATKAPAPEPASYVDADKLREAVDMREAVTMEDLVNSNWFNSEKLSGPIEAQKLMETTGMVLEESGALKRWKLDKPEKLETTMKKSMENVSGMLGIGIGDFTRRLKKLADDTVEQNNMVVTGDMVLQSIGREIDKVSKEIDQAVASGKGKDELELKMLDLLETSANIQTYLKAIQTAGARTTTAGRLVRGDAVSSETLTRLEAAGGSEKIRKLARTIKDMGGDPIKLSKAARAAAKGPDAIDAFLAYRMSNMLSGWTTQALNITANTVNMAVRPGERIVGGLIDSAVHGEAGGGRQIREGARQYREYFNLREVLIPAIRMAGRTAWNDKQSLDNITKFDTRTDVSKALSPETIGITNSDNPLHALTRTTMNVEGLPLRALGTADEFFKQIAFRARVRAKLMEDATTVDFQKLGYANRGEFVEDNFQKAFTRLEDLEAEWAKMVRQGRVTDNPETKDAFIEANIDSWNPGSNYAVDGIREARAVTFTTPLEQGSISKGVETLANNHRFLRIFAPFIRTPVNVISEGWQRSPGVLANVALDQLGLMRSKFVRDLKSSDPNVRAETEGKLATATMLTMGAMWLAQEGRLTGHGPSDPAMRDTWKKDPNWQPASLDIGTPENPKLIQLNRADPWAWNLIMAADLNEMLEADAEDPTVDGSNLVSMLITATADNVTNKTWMQGVSGAFEVLEGGNRPWLAERWAKNQITSLMPLGNLGRQINRELEPHQKEIETFFDAAKQSIPGMTSDLPDRYNWLTGEPIDNPTHILGFLKYKEAERDWVGEEMRNLRYGFTGPDRKIMGFELTPEQRQEWNRMMGQAKDPQTGLTLHQMLAKAMKSPEYDFERKRTPDGQTAPVNSHRVAIVRDIVSAYKGLAKDLLLRKYPELNQKIEQHEIFLEKSYRGTAGPEDTNPLLDQ